MLQPTRKQYLKTALLLLMCALTAYSIGQTKSNIQNYKKMKWDFNSFKTLTFNYKQTMSNNVSLLFDGEDRPKTIAEFSGDLVVEVKEKGKANVSFKNITMANFKLDTTGKKTKTTEQKMPDMFIIEGLLEDGFISGSLNPEFVFFSKTFFPIINHPITVGEVYNLPMSIPLDVIGKSMDIKGVNQVSYASNKNSIAQLETNINITEFIEPKGENTYECSLIGTSAFSFNLEKGFYTDGQVDLKIVMGEQNIDQKDMDMDVEIKFNLANIK